MTINERFVILLKTLNISVKDAAVMFNKSEGYVRKLMRTGESFGIEPVLTILNSIDSISADWLLTGKGDMIVDDNNVRSDCDGLASKAYDKIVEDGDSNCLLVPVIHIDSVGGIRSSNSIVDEKQYVEGYVPFNDAKEGDLAIYQSGNSMNPTIPPGSLMQIREVHNWREYFGYGNIFVIELSDGRRITKEITRYEPNPTEYVWCVSHNPDVPDEELPKSMIVSVWKVMKILTDKGW